MARTIEQQLKQKKNFSIAVTSEFVVSNMGQKIATTKFLLFFNSRRWFFFLEKLITIFLSTF
jgi:hypothetical protein